MRNMSSTANTRTSGGPARGLITCVLTSCTRYDLLQITLESFLSANTAPLERLIVVEDGPAIPAEFRKSFVRSGVTWLSTGRRVGQIAAVDYAYSHVTTPYIFHMEDDWEFYWPGFIEKSLAVLEANPKCLLVQIRALDDTNGHPVEPHTYCDQGVEWRRLALEFRDQETWHGFSFNPGLRRLADYVSIQGYGIHTRFDPRRPGASESAVGEIYRARNFYAAILADGDGAGYVRHIGHGRHVLGPGAGVVNILR